MHLEGDAILSGCFRTLLDKPQRGCASIINPGKWQLAAVSESCANMQGGLTLRGGKLLVSGLFHQRVEFHQINVTTNHTLVFPTPLEASKIGNTRTVETLNLMSPSEVDQHSAVHHYYTA